MINLLPPEQKEEVLREKSFKLVLILGTIAVVFLICLSLILSTIAISISGQINYQKILVDTEKEENIRLEPIEEKLKLINVDLSRINSFYEDRFSLIIFLQRIYDIAPKEIRLTDFSYQKENGRVTLSGHSPAVKHLVGFKENLEKQDDLSRAYFPPSLWVNPADIDFNITFNIAKDESKE